MADTPQGLQRKFEQIKDELTVTKSQAELLLQRNADLEQERGTYLASHAELVKKLAQATSPVTVMQQSIPDKFIVVFFVSMAVQTVLLVLLAVLVTLR